MAKVETRYFDGHEIDGMGITGFLDNFFHFYNLDFRQTSQFYSKLTGEILSSIQSSFKSYCSYYDALETFHFNPILSKLDMRVQMTIATWFFEVYKLFQLHYKAFINQLQRHYGVPIFDRVKLNNQFLKEAKSVWPKTSKRLEQQHEKMNQYSTFRNKLAHDSICKVSYPVNFKKFEDFLLKSDGIKFDPNFGRILRVKDSCIPESKMEVKNIYAFHPDGSFITQFFNDSCLFLVSLHNEFFPQYFLSGYQKPSSNEEMIKVIKESSKSFMEYLEGLKTKNNGIKSSK